jgi:hypothetical protein
METSFPDRYYVLRKYFLIEFFMFIILIVATIGCEPKKEYYIDPVPVFSEVVRVDSSYTTVEVVSTGYSDSLFCGKKGIFDSYSIMKFDSIPYDFDSLFLSLKSGSASVMLILYELKKEWSEDSTYLWSDIDSLIDMLNPLLTEAVNDSNPKIFIGNSSTLDESLIDAINGYGLAVHSDSFYSFGAGETEFKFKVEIEDTLVDSVISCVEDAYIVKNPFQDTIFTDSFLVGRGLSIRTHMFIPRDSLPLELNSIAKADLCFGVLNQMPFNVGFISIGSYYLYTKTPYSESESDSLKFDLVYYFKELSHDSILHLQIRATDDIGGIGVASLGDLENIGIQFVWVEFPR